MVGPRPPGGPQLCSRNRSLSDIRRSSRRLNPAFDRALFPFTFFLLRFSLNQLCLSAGSFKANLKSLKTFSRSLLSRQSPASYFELSKVLRASADEDYPLARRSFLPKPALSCDLCPASADALSPVPVGLSSTAPAPFEAVREDPVGIGPARPEMLLQVPDPLSESREQPAAALPAEEKL